MTVTLRQRNKNGKISLYLDFYHKGKRKLEYLSLYLTEKPSTTEERALNKKTSNWRKISGQSDFWSCRIQNLDLAIQKG